jgi:type IV pilus assembly protein PilW
VKARHAARGLALVELMVGLALGLFVVAAAGTALAAHARDSRRLLLAARVQQDLRITADLVVRELRRAGRWRAAEAVVWSADLPASAAANPYAGLAGFEAGQPTSAGSLLYERADGGSAIAMRLQGGAVEWRIGAGVWQQLTDPALVTVTRFDLLLRQQTLDLGRFCALPCPAADPACSPTQAQREIQLVLEAHATGEPALQRTLRAGVRPRADALTGACPA